MPIPTSKMKLVKVDVSLYYDKDTEMTQEDLDKIHNHFLETLFTEDSRLIGVEVDVKEKI